MPTGSVGVMDVTDQSFQADVLERSNSVPVVVDLWAPWCGPCKTLGPMLEAAVAETDGAVELAKVNVDENPRVAAQFQVQSIPAVYAVKDAQVVDGFIGALPQAEVTAFIERLAPAASEADTLAAAGDEASLRKALELEPDHAAATAGLARILIDRGDAPRRWPSCSACPSRRPVEASLLRLVFSRRGWTSRGATAPDRREAQRVARPGTN